MTEESVTISSRKKLKERAADEFKRMIVIALYLWVVFALMSIHKSFVLAQHHLDYPEHFLAIINALVFAKVILVGEHFHLGERFFKDKPLIYPTLYKSFIFTVLSVGFHLLETALVGLWHGKSIREDLVATGMGSVPGFLSVCVMFFILLSPFFGFEELGRVIGRKELWDLTFKNRATVPRPTL